MGYDNHFTGAITITPPLTRKQIREAAPENFKDIRFRIVERQIESDDGETVTVHTTADAVVPFDTTYSGSRLEEEIQSIVDTFGDHEFAGFIEAQWDAGFGEPPSRFIVKDGRVMRIDAQYRWPGLWGDEPDADTVLPSARQQIAAELEAHAESIGWYEGGGVWAEALDVIRRAPWTQRDGDDKR
jgi:Family of unknown function (DUF6205)